MDLKDDDETIGTAPISGAYFCTDFEDMIYNVTSKIRGNELKILDEFSKAFLASEMLNGKDLIGILNEFELTIQTRHVKDSKDTFETTYSYERKKV